MGSEQLVFEKLEILIFLALFRFLHP